MVAGGGGALDVIQVNVFTCCHAINKLAHNLCNRSRARLHADTRSLILEALPKKLVKASCAISVCHR